MGVIVSCIRQGIRKKILSISQKKYYSLGRDLVTTNFQIRCKFSSREHCIIACRNKQVFIYDLNSQHGTYINNNKVNVKRSIMIQKRDLLVIGTSIKKYFFIKQSLNLKVFDIISKKKTVTNSRRSQEFWKRKKNLKLFTGIFKRKYMKSMKRIIFKEDLTTRIILSYNINFLNTELTHKKIPQRVIGAHFLKIEKKKSFKKFNIKKKNNLKKQNLGKSFNKNSKEFCKNRLTLLKEQIKNIDKVVKDLQLGFKTKKIKSKFLGISTHLF